MRDERLVLVASADLAPGAPIAVPLDSFPDALFLRRGSVPAPYAPLDRTLLFSSLAPAAKAFEKIVAASASASGTAAGAGGAPRAFPKEAPRVAAAAAKAVRTKLGDLLRAAGYTEGMPLAPQGGAGGGVRAGTGGAPQAPQGEASAWLLAAAEAAAFLDVGEAPFSLLGPTQQGQAAQAAATSAEAAGGGAANALKLPLYAWGGGKLDPRLLASLAALHHLAEHGTGETRPRPTVSFLPRHHAVLSLERCYATLCLSCTHLGLCTSRLGVQARWCILVSMNSIRK